MQGKQRFVAILAMLEALEKYRFRGEVHRSALLDLPQREALTVSEKERLSTAYSYGKYGTLAVQFPFITLIYYAEKRIRPLPLDKRVLWYVSLSGVYGLTYMLTKAWTWHQAFYSVEDVVKRYVESISVQDLRTIEEERKLGVLKAEKDKVYTPKD